MVAVPPSSPRRDDTRDTYARINSVGSPRSLAEGGGGGSGAEPPMRDRRGRRQLARRAMRRRRSRRRGSRPRIANRRSGGRALVDLDGPPVRRPIHLDGELLQLLLQLLLGAGLQLTGPLAAEAEVVADLV